MSSRMETSCISGSMSEGIQRRPIAWTAAMGRALRGLIRLCPALLLAACTMGTSKPQGVRPALVAPAVDNISVLTPVRFDRGRHAAKGGWDLRPACVRIAVESCRPDLPMLDRPAASSPPHPPVILISIDGFRPDYLDRGLTPNLLALASRGVRGSLRPSFPTKTFPNHYALVTGLVPDHNGIVGNSMIDPRRPNMRFSLGDAKQSLDPFWWDEAEPLWVTAERAGQRTATMFWPGSEVAIQGTRPRDWLRYDEHVSDRQRVDTVLDWLARPAWMRPDFVTLYFEEVDTAGHEFGPNSPELNRALVQVDSAIGRLMQGWAELGVAPDVIVVADHGMAAVSPQRVIRLDRLIDLASIIVVESGPYAAIEPAAATDNRVYDALLKPHDHMRCSRKEQLPERLHYGGNPRVAAIICLADPGWLILAREPDAPVTGGAHGWDNGMPEMAALFVAAGPDIVRRPAPLPIVNNVEIYPLLARLLGVQPRASDARGTLLSLTH